MKIITNFSDIPECAGVYCITEIKTGKKYVGSSINIFNRAEQHRYNKHPTSSLLSAVGNGKVVFDILETGSYPKRMQLYRRELYWIMSLGTVHPIGFNQLCPVTREYLTKSGRKITDKTNYGKIKTVSANIMRDY